MTREEYIELLRATTTEDRFNELMAERKIIQCGDDCDYEHCKGWRTEMVDADLGHKSTLDESMEVLQTHQHSENESAMKPQNTERETK